MRELLIKILFDLLELLAKQVERLSKLVLKFDPTTKKFRFQEA